MRALALAAALVACVPGCKSQPGSVDLTIVADASLPDATVAAIRILDITVTGAAMVDQSYLVAKPFSSARQERLLVRPPVSSGMLMIAVLARAAAGTPVGYGQTQVTLKSSDAVAAQVILTGNLPPGGDMGRPGDMGSVGPSLALVAGRIGGIGFVDGIGKAARFHHPRDLAYEGGNLYVADMNNHVIRKIVPSTGAVSTVAGTAMMPGSADGTGSAARFQRPHGVVGDGAGNLYITDMRNDTIRKLVLATGTVTTLAGTPNATGSADGIGAAARFYHPHSIAYDGAGNLYIADSGNATIRKLVIAGGVVTTVAGTPGMRALTDGTGAAARFSAPHGVAFDGGNLYVADAGNNAIRQIVVATGVVTTLAGNGGSGSADGAGAAAQFNSPRGIVADGAGNLWVADSSNHRLRKVVIAGGVVTTLAGGAFGPYDGIGAGAGFELPCALASDGAGNLYVVDAFGNTVRKVVISGAAVTTLVGYAGADGLVDGTGAGARFRRPHGLWADGGTLYVADKASNAVRKIDLATAQVTTVAGADPSGSADGTGAAARFSGPYALVSDGAGKLYVADANNATIRTIALATNAVTTLAGSAGNRGSADGIGAAARFQRPAGLALDGGNLYVADSDNATIRKIDVASGAVTTIAGSAGNRGSADGIGAAARFQRPAGLALDGGNLYVADQNNATIRRVVVATADVATIAGSAGVRGSTDGPGSVARFNMPHSLVADGAGNLYVADTLSQTLRKIVISSTVVSTVAGSPDVASVKLGPAPGVINTPSGIALGPGGALYFTTTHENAILVMQ